jgi:hypothetical protein
MPAARSRSFLRQGQWPGGAGNTPARYVPASRCVALVRIIFSAARRGVPELDVTDAEAEKLGDVR